MGGTAKSRQDLGHLSRVPLSPALRTEMQEAPGLETALLGSVPLSVGGLPSVSAFGIKPRRRLLPVLWPWL